MSRWSASLVMAAWLVPGVASACPMCSESIVGDPNLPQAYMASILFMLATPAVVLGVLGGLVVRAVRAADAAHEPQLARVLARPRGAGES
jgi:hypothetical protein